MMKNKKTCNMDSMLLSIENMMIDQMYTPQHCRGKTKQQKPCSHIAKCGLFCKKHSNQEQYYRECSHIVYHNHDPLELCNETCPRYLK